MRERLSVVTGGGGRWRGVWATRRPPGDFRWLLESRVRSDAVRGFMDRLVPRKEAPAWPRRTKGDLLDLFFYNWPDGEDETWAVLGEQIDVVCEFARGRQGWGWDRLEAALLHLPKSALLEAAEALEFQAVRPGWSKVRTLEVLRRDEVYWVVYHLPHDARRWLAERTGEWPGAPVEHQRDIEAFFVTNTVVVGHPFGPEEAMTPRLWRYHLVAS